MVCETTQDLGDHPVKETESPVALAEAQKEVGSNKYELASVVTGEEPEIAVEAARVEVAAGETCWRKQSYWRKIDHRLYSTWQFSFASRQR